MRTESPTPNLFGLLLCTAGLFDAIEKATARNHDELGEAFEELAFAVRLHFADVAGRQWLDVGAPEAHIEAEGGQSFHFQPRLKAGWRP